MARPPYLLSLHHVLAHLARTPRPGTTTAHPRFSTALAGATVPCATERCVVSADRNAEVMRRYLEEVVGVWRWRGTHSAELFGVPATGRALDITVASIFKTRDGKIVDYMVVAGALQAVQQMGVSITL